METKEIVVVFRVWFPDESEPLPFDVQGTHAVGHLIALFPESPSDLYGDGCDSYEHIGQHGGADYYGIVATSRAATELEYVGLLEELKGIYERPQEGDPYEYKLKVMEHTPELAREWRWARRKQAQWYRENPVQVD